MLLSNVLHRTGLQINDASVGQRNAVRVHTGRQLASDFRRDKLSIRPDCNGLGPWTQQSMSLLLLLSNMLACSFLNRATAGKVKVKSSTVVTL